MLWNNVARRHFCITVLGPCLLATAGWVLVGPSIDVRAGEDVNEINSVGQPAPAFKTERLHGKVVWMAEGLKSKFGISTVPEAAESVLAFQTNDGKLLPIVENSRGRAFRKDERLRGKEMEVLVRRYEQQPMIQILRVYQHDGKALYEVDYWCDVCAIVMFETGPCACCQDHNRLRLRLVDKSGDTTAVEKPLQ